MKILGIDTTTKFLSIGLYDEGSVCEYNLDLGFKHAALLIPTIKRVLDARGLEVRDIDYFACGLGPGSFTGIRVGLSTIKGLSWSLKKPVVGFSTLDILARGVNISDRCIFPIIDAKRSLIYCSVYKIKGDHSRKISPYMLLGIDELLKKIKDAPIILGDGLSLYKEKILKNVKGVTFLDKDCWYPRGHNIITLALEKIKLKKFDTPFKVKPIYLYPKECQIRI